MNRPVALDAALATNALERKSELRQLPMWSFIIVVGIVVIAALVSDRSLTPDQRIEVSQQSGMYP